MASERTFQILTQVAGRAGRDKDKGKVIIQTYNPDNFSIEFSKKQDYKLFYNLESTIRKQLKYPPFCDIIMLGFNSESEQSIQKIANEVHTYLKNKIKTDNIPIILYKPVPAPIDKIKNKYRWRIIIKCKFGDNIIEVINECINNIFNGKNRNVSLIVDVNPNNML